MTSFLCLAVLLATLSPSPPAPAAPEEQGRFPFQVSGTNTFLWRSFDPEFLERNPRMPQDRWELYNRLVLNISRGPVLVGLQLDLDRFDLREGDHRLEKRYIEFRSRRWTATAGDFFAAFGRGTALSVAKTHELYGLENQIDNTVDGGRLRFRDRRLMIEGLVGRVYDRALDVTDNLYGGTASYRLTRWLRLGASAVRGELEAEALDADLAGAQVELRGLGGIADVAYEYTTLSSSRPFANGAESGRAAYLEVAVQWRGLMLSAEYEDLENFFFEYSTPPMLEEEGQELLADFLAVHPEDLEGVKFRADYMLPNGSMLFGTYARFNERATRHPSYFRYDRSISHFYGGVEHNFVNGTHLMAMAGRRSEESEGYFYQFSGPTTHCALEATLPLPRRLSFGIEYRRSQLRGDLVDYTRNKLAVSFARSQLFSITGVWESSNLPGEVYFTGKENFYFAQVDVQLFKAHLVRLFYGETRGGVKCSGGVCKYVPAFRGTRLEVVIRF